jgi:hypothetical protein
VRSIRRPLQRYPSPFVEPPYEDVGMLSEERRRLSGLVGEPETRGERPSSCAGMLSVFGQQLSELAELPLIFVSTLEVFGPRPCACGRMFHSFRRMPCAFGAPPLSAPMAAPEARSDAHEEAWAALFEERDAVRKPWDALVEPRDAPAIRKEAMRRRRRDLRRVTRLSRNSPDALPSVDHTAAEPRACPPIPRETERARRELFGARDDAPRIRRAAQRVFREAARGEDDAQSKAKKPASTPPSSGIHDDGRYLVLSATFKGF